MTMFDNHIAQGIRDSILAEVRFFQLMTLATARHRNDNNIHARTSRITKNGYPGISVMLFLLSLY
jgi:hypothetical protein